MMLVVASLGQLSTPGLGWTVLATTASAAPVGERLPLGFNFSPHLSSFSPAERA